MASLSNINGIFDVHSTGAILFSTSHGTSGQILKSNGNAAPTWIPQSDIVGAYLPLAGGTLTGATATASGISFTVGGTLSGSTATFSGNVTGPRFIGTSDRTEAVDSNDTRNTNPDPEDIGKGVYFDFKTNSANGLSDGGSYNGMMLWRSYGGGSDLSGGQPIRLAYTANGNLWRQMGTGATSWGAWNKFAIGTGTTAQYIRGDASLATFPTIPPDPTGVYLPLAGGTLTGATATASGISFTVGGDLTVGDATATNQGLRIESGNGTGDYGVVRFKHGGTNRNTIHAFSQYWQSGTIYTAATDSLNFDGHAGVTIGPWNNIDVAFVQGGASYFKNDVGIGTTSPGAKLVLATTAGASTQLRLQRVDGAETGMIYMDTSDDLNIRNTGGSGDIILYPHPTSGNTIVNYGNVGIGVTSPSTKLEVLASQSNSSIRAGGLEMQSYAVNNSWYAENLYYNAGWKLRSNGYATQMYMQGGKITFNRFVSGNAGDFVTPYPTMILGSNGNVGIGTTSPATKLDVYQGDIRRSGIVSGGYIEMGSLPGYSTNAYQSLTSGGTIHFANNGKYCAYFEGANTYFGILNSSFQTQVKFNTNGDSFINGGNVGIGTTAPSEKLHVVTTALFGPNGSTSRSTDGVGINFTNNNTFSANADITDANRYLAITNDSTTANTYAPLSFRINPNGGSSNAMADIKLVSNGSTHHLTTTIRNPATGNFIDTISIAQDGNVGIGNTSPQTTLHTGPTTTVTNVFTARFAASNFFASGGNSMFYVPDTAANIMMFGSNQFGTNQIEFYHKNPGTSQAYVGRISTSSSATSYVTSSDYRLKENIVPISDSISRLNQLKPSRFNFIEEPGKIVDGFIAHEVQDIVPEAIVGEKDEVDEDGGIIPQGIDQAKLVPLLVAAVQELEARVKELENK